MTSLMDEYPMPGMEMDPRELEKAKYLALMRMGLGMASREPIGRAAGAGIATYSTMEENARRNADQKMQEARTKMQYAIAMKKADEEQKAELRKAQFIKSIPDDELRAYGIPDPLIAGFKQAEKPEEYLKALDQFKSYTMSAGNTRFNAAGGVQNQLPNEAGVVTKFDPTGAPTGRQLLPGSTESAGAIAYASELAKRKAEAETTFEEMPVAGDKAGATEKVLRSKAIAEQGGGGTSTSGYRVPPQVQAQRDVVRLQVLNKELADAVATGNKTNIAALQQEIAIVQGKAPTGATADFGNRRIKYPAPPEGYRRPEAGDGLEPIPGGPKDTSQQDIIKSTNAVERASMVVNKIDDIDKDVSWTTAGPASTLLGAVPGTPQFDLRKRIEMVQANIGFQELAAMRAASPTGGALGQVAVRELEFLQASLGSLDSAQSPTELKKNLKQVKVHFNNWKKIMEQAGAKVSRGASVSWDEKSDPLGLR